MTLFLSPVAGASQQFLDNSGNPLTGGLLYTYAAGTTTPQSTFTTSAGTTPHSNPIILDAAGRLDSEVWLTGGVAYKFVLRDSVGALLGTYDDLYGINDVSATNVPWADVTGTPTTLAGYGITNGLSTTVAAATYAPIADAALTGTTTVQDGATPTPASHRAGYVDVPQNLKSVNYALVLADRGKSVVMNGTSLTLTIPANASVAFPVGAAIVVINVNSSALSIAITSDTLTLVNSTTTGTRTLAQNGMATLVKVGSTNWIIAGLGVT
jgi:hypothetical protein